VRLSKTEAETVWEAPAVTTKCPRYCYVHNNFRESWLIASGPLSREHFSFAYCWKSSTVANPVSCVSPRLCFPISKAQSSKFWVPKNVGTWWLEGEDVLPECAFDNDSHPSGDSQVWLLELWALRSRAVNCDLTTSFRTFNLDVTCSSLLCRQISKSYAQYGMDGD